MGRPSDSTYYAAIIAFIAAAAFSSVDSAPRALAIGCCGSLFGMSGSSMTDFAFSSERKNRTHLSRIRPVSFSSHPSSIRTYCDSTFFVSPSYTDLMFWKNPSWSPIRNCFSNSTTCCSKNECCTSHSLQSVTLISDSAPQLRIPGVHFQALPGCVHYIRCSLQLSFRLDVSTLTSPWSPSLRG